MNRKTHWENIYSTKQPDEVSWYQPTPSTSLAFIAKAGLTREAKIIDIGAGDSFLVDHLLDLGYQNLTVLDISQAAIDRARQRLGDRADKVTWIVADAADFRPTEQYDFWHDRAAFHFLTDESDIEKYLAAVHQGLSETGTLLLGTFSENGPAKCSGIAIRQYSEAAMTERVGVDFRKIECVTVDHKTPFDTVQNFLFCSFRKNAVPGA